jgi:hypothetical protein
MNSSSSCSTRSRSKSPAAWCWMTRHRIGGRPPSTRCARWTGAGRPFCPASTAPRWFNRGETQSLCARSPSAPPTTPRKWTPSPAGDEEKPFILHYNFPPYSVGEVGRLGIHQPPRNRPRQPGRALDPAHDPQGLPLQRARGLGNHGLQRLQLHGQRLRRHPGPHGCRRADDPPPWPASPSACSPAEDGRAELVTDILGTEDHCGDMDFKVCRHPQGHHRLPGGPEGPRPAWEQREKAPLSTWPARVARRSSTTWSRSSPPRRAEDLSPYAPRYDQVRINPEKIGALIGPGGKNIRRITDTTGAKIDINDDGTVMIFAHNPAKSMDAAVREVNLARPTPEVGKLYQGTVTGTKEFGAFVEILPGKEGLVHISETGQLPREVRRGHLQAGRRDVGQVPERRRQRQGPPEPQGRHGRDGCPVADRDERPGPLTGAGPFFCPCHPPPASPSAAEPPPCLSS